MATKATAALIQEEPGASSRSPRWAESQGPGPSSSDFLSPKQGAGPEEEQAQHKPALIWDSGT